MIRFTVFAVCAILAAGFASATFAQGSQVYVTADKTTFVWGETVKVKATVRDAQGVEQRGSPVTWSVFPAGSGTIASDGTITPLQLRDLTIRATTGNLFGEILVQPIPKKVVVTPDAATMTVGSTQRVRVAALDINDQPIPNVPIQWDLFNASGGWDINNPMATIDSSGNLKSLVAGRLEVVVRIPYDYNPWLLSYYEGLAYVQMMAPLTYKFERVFMAKPAGNTSVLAPSRSALLPANGGVDFVASLDGLGSAFVEWTPDQTTPIAISGRAHVVTGQPLIQFGKIARNHAGNVLFLENDAGGAFQISSGAVAHPEPLLVANTPLNGADGTFWFQMDRNSLADSGYKVFEAGYSDAVTHTSAVGLLRGLSTGLSEMIVNTIDGLQAFPGKSFNISSYGVADDGTVWFILQIDPSGLNRSVLFRARPGLGPEVMLSQGDTLAGAPVTSLNTFNLNQFCENFFVAANGDLVMTANTSQGSVLLRWSSSSTAPETFATKTGGSPGTDGIYWYEPSIGALVNTRINNGPRALYLWNSSGTTSLVTIGTTAVDGSIVREVFSATADSQGVVYAMVRTDASAMVIARILPDVQALLKAGDAIPIGGVPVIGAMIPGAGTGTPLLLTGGQTGGVSKIAGPSSLQPLIRVGDPAPGGGTYAGSTISGGSGQARSLGDGRVVVADTNGVYTWNNGVLDWFVKFPIPSTDGQLSGSVNSFTLNRQGDLAFNIANSNIYIVRNGTATRVVNSGQKVGPAGTYYATVPIIDDSGHVGLSVIDPAGQYYVALYDGSTTRVILSAGSVMPDGRVVRTVGGKLAGSGGFLVTTVTLNDGQVTYVRYRPDAWEYIIGKNDRTATGNFVQSPGVSDVNSAGDLAFFFGSLYTQHIAVKRGATFQEVQSLADLTPDGDALIGITQLLFNDDGTLFVLAVNDQGQQVVYRATPLKPPVNINFQITDRSATSQTTSGSGNSVQVGFAGIIPTAGSTTPSGMAIFDFTQNGILISEAAVPASPLIQSGRTYAEIGGAVDTGIAIANPNTQTVTITFYYTDATGRNVFSGTTTVGANSQIAAFLDQAPFMSQLPAPDMTSVRTFTFTSSLPVGVTALRGYTNERGEFLITTLPVSAINTSSSEAFAFPHYADGGSWTSALVLINPTDSIITGSARFFSNGTATAAGAPVSLTANGTSAGNFNYTIPPRSAFKLQTSGLSSAVQTGWVSVTPNSGSVAPSGLVVFSFQSNGVRVSEAGVAALPASTAFRIYAESAGNFSAAKAGSIQTGIAISNPGLSNVTVRFDLTNLDGTPTGISGTQLVPATGQIALFLNQIPGFGALPASFKGILRVSDANVFVTGLRGRYNERNDFLITTTAPVDENAAPATGEFVFPHLADGGGYTTQVILFSGTAGQSANGVLQFVSQSGQALSLTFH